MKLYLNNNKYQNKTHYILKFKKLRIGLKHYNSSKYTQQFTKLKFKTCMYTTILFFFLFPKGNWLSLINYSCCKWNTQIFSMLIYIFISALSSTDISLKFQEKV